MKGDISYFSEDKFLLGLDELSSRQNHISENDMYRLARDSTDKQVRKNLQLVKRSEIVANSLLKKHGYVLMPTNISYLKKSDFREYISSLKDYGMDLLEDEFLNNIIPAYTDSRVKNFPELVNRSWDPAYDILEEEGFVFSAEGFELE